MHIHHILAKPEPEIQEEHVQGVGSTQVSSYEEQAPVHPTNIVSFSFQTLFLSTASPGTHHSCIKFNLPDYPCLPYQLVDYH
jgi:hypothetical protein